MTRPETSSTDTPGIDRDQTLLTRLKHETRHAHRKLENDLDLLRANLSIPTYTRILERFYGFYLPWERTLLAAAPAELVGFYKDREKTPKLTADLIFLGACPSMLPACDTLPLLTDLPRILGSLYVIEGSTLGGQLIARHLEHTLGFASGRGYAFFSSYGTNVATMWKRFRNFLLQNSSQDKEDVIICSANDTFLCLHDCLCKI